MHYCPKHNEPLQFKRILWGLPGPGVDLDQYILGGCLVGEGDPDYGYVCPVDQEVYIKNDKGELVDWDELHGTHEDKNNE